MSASTTPMTVRRTAMLGAMLTSIGPVSMAIYTPAMPELVRAFATTESAIKMSLTLYFGGFAIAQLVAGAMSMAAGEYVSVHSQADTEQADLARERTELDEDPAAEVRELTAIYVGRGLPHPLASQVAPS